MTTSPDASSSRTVWPLVAGAIAVVLAIIVTGIVLLTRDDGADEAPSAAAPATTAAPVDADAEGFSTPRSDVLGRKVDVPLNGRGVILPQSTQAQKGFDDPAAMTTAAEGIRWQQSAGVVIPFSTSDGPARMDGQIPVGFARTPAGAALAAASLYMRLFDGALGPETVQKRFDPSAPTYAQALKQVEELPADASAGHLVPRPSGYELEEDCGPDYCLVWLHMPGTDGITRAMPTVVVWTDGDWSLSYNEVQVRQGTDPGLVRW